MLDDLRIRLRALFRRSAVEGELEEELRFHFEHEAEKYRRGGMSDEEARRRARLAFGGQEQIKEDCREARGTSLVESSLQDVRYAVRQLWANPTFAIVIILTLALSIGANSAIFSVVDGVVLAPLPYSQPDRLVTVWESRPNVKQLAIPLPDFQDWQRNSSSFERMAAVLWRDFDLTGPGTSEHLDGLEVSSGFLATLGVEPVLGRDFSSAEDQPHGAAAAIISDRLWRERFASSPQALGKAIILDGVDYTVIGILPPKFHFWTGADVYTSLARGEPLFYGDRTIHGSVGIARLKPGISIGQAQSELSAVQAGLDRLYPTADRNLGVFIDPLKEEIVGDTRGTLLLLLGAVAMVLLIACANVANLLLARSAVRTREFAIRMALGASRARMIRQLLTESTLLALTGGVLGLGLARFGVSLVLATIPESLPRAESVSVNLPVLFFTLGISVVVGIVFGLAPALKSSRADVQGSLKPGDRGSTRVGSRGQSALVIVQMALTLVLLVGSGLLLRAIRHLWSVDPGFNAQHVLTFKVGLSPSLTKTASSTRTAYRQLLDRIRQIPSVRAADFTNIVPLSDKDNGGPFWVGAKQSTPMQDAPHALYFETGPDYLQTMKIPLLRGRFFTPADTSESEPVVVIDSVLAHTYFPDKDPVGQTITVAHWRSARVIGVVGHVRHWGLGDPGTYNPSQIYISFYQLSDEWVPSFARDLSIALRTRFDTATMMPAIKNVIYGAGKDQPVYNIQTMQQIASDSMASQRFALILLGAFAGLALLLASVGIYGVISYSVSQRVQEIGIRMALGAEKRQIFQMVIRQGLRLALAGLVIGGVAAFILGRFLESFSRLLYGVRASDPVTFIAVSAVLIGVALSACYLPARRATKADPMNALRAE